MLKLLFIICPILLFSSAIFAHAGSHGNDECLVKVGKTELRLNGYQFKGANPDRHYCRYFPHLGHIIIKVDSISADLSKMAIELQLLKRQSWLGLLLNSDDAFSVIKQQNRQYFSRQVVSFANDIEEMDVYALSLRLIDGNGMTSEQRFLFLVGFPFAQIMVSIAGLLLLFIIFISIRRLIAKRHE